MFASGKTAAVASAANYIEDVFSTYLYNGTGSAQTITNGIDLSTYGGLVWGKMRNDTGNNFLQDTARGTGQTLCSNNTDGNTATSTYITAFNSTGFTLGTNLTVNGSSYTYASWTFRKQPKFFDVVTYTGNGGSSQTINHNLGSVPGCMIVKSTSTVENWKVYHRSLGTPAYQYLLNLNTTDPRDFSTSRWASDPTSTTFTVASNTDVNASGVTYVAYLFAHNAGGFGLTGTDDVISCGSVTNSGGSQYNDVSLGWEPQWLLVKNATGTSTAYWQIVDNMRGLTNNNVSTAVCNTLRANAANAESNPGNLQITATGFRYYGTSYSNGDTLIYIAIRRGPMKVPTSGTSVFTPITYNGNGTSQTITGSVGVPDLGLGIGRSGGMAGQNTWYDRLRGKQLALISSSTNAQYDAAPGGEGTMTTTMNGMIVENTYGRLNDGTTPYILYFLTRAPSFFDEVCYTGNGSTQNITHNLGVAPEFLIVKPRNSSAYDWNCYHVSLGNTKYIALNTTLADSSAVSLWNNTTPTSTVFTVNHPAVNDSGGTYVAYLFATCTGVSKVGSYTGTGTTKQVDCGFTGGARFVLIKRTDSTGDWYVWDSARGIVSGNDPYLLLNSTAAEVTNTDYIDTYSAGFEISSTAPAAINASGGTFIFLAIA